MGRKVLWVLAALAALGLMASAWAGAKARRHASVAATKGACELTGTANISPGLTTATHPIGFSFTGKLAQCKGVTGVTGGTVSASGTGTGACTGNATAGTGTISWNTGQQSSFSFSTAGNGVVVRVTGKIASGAFAGLPVKAELVFYTGSPQKCVSGGLPAASFAGPASLGV